MKVGIYTNKLKDSDGAWTNKIQTELAKYGIEHVEIRQDSKNYDIDLLLMTIHFRSKCFDLIL